MGESWGDLVAGEYMFSHGYSNGGNPWAVGAYATGNKTVAHPRLRHQPQPAQLLRLRLRLHRRRGPRRRRDLERHPVGGPPGPGRRSGTRTFPYDRQGAPAALRPGAPRPVRRCPAEPVPGQPPLGPADVRRVPAPAGRDVDAGRPRRDARRRPDALRRRRTRRSCGTRSPRAAWARAPRRPNADSGEPTPSFASPRSTQRHGDVPGPGRRRASTSATTRPGPPRSPTPVPQTELGRTSCSWPPAATRCCSSRAARGFKRFTVTVAAGQRTTVRLAAPRRTSPAQRHGAKVHRRQRRARSTPRPSSTAPRPPTGAASTTARNVDATQPVRGGRPGRRRAPVRRVQVSAMLRPGAGRPDRRAAGAGRPGLRARGSPRCAGSRSRPASAAARRPARPGSGSTPRPADAFPALAAAAGGAEPDPALFDVPGHPRRRGPARGAGEPVHRLRRATPASRTPTRPTTPTARRRRTAGTIVHAAELQVY